MIEHDTITFATEAIEVGIRVGSDKWPAITRIATGRALKHGSATPERSLIPLVEVRLIGEGNAGHKTSKALIGSAVSQRLRYVEHSETQGALWRKANVNMRDEKTGLEVMAELWLSNLLPVLRSRASVRNGGTLDIVVEQVSSVCIGGLARDQWWHSHTMMTATNTWFREAQWREESFSDLGIDDFGFHRRSDGPPAGSKAAWGLSSRTTWPTNGHLPMGILKSKDEVWLWQVENNGGWRFEVADAGDGLYLATSGPDATTGDWAVNLAPAESVVSPWTAVMSSHDVEDAFGVLTRYRRQILRHHPDNEHMPVIFNDYMNCLMGDPTEEKVSALLKPAKDAGAEYFVIDAGWFARMGDWSWFTDVGEWKPSKDRFPSGLDALTKKIRDHGMIPGMWVEPEVVGVTSSVLEWLPDEAFFQRRGVRVQEHGRYHLDYRSPVVIKHMDEVIDRLVTGLGLGYFKFDYNVEITTGTDRDCFSPGEGQAGHQRAFRDWVRSLLDRYPGLVIENCGSGAQRMEYDLLSVFSIQSTSDQEDPELYAPIAAACPTAVLPEQGAVWAYPQPSWSDEIIAYTVANSLLGRIHLSGRVDLLSAHQHGIVKEGMDVYKSIRSELRHALPFWPMGLPHWHDEWHALGMRAGHTYFITVWRRGGPTAKDLPIPRWRGKEGKVELLYPASFEASAEWKDGAVWVTLPATVCARLFKITA